MIDGFSVLKTYSFSHEAHLDQAKLLDENIDARLMDEQISNVYPGIGYAVGIKIIVPDEDIQKANDILNSNESQSLEGM